MRQISKSAFLKGTQCIKSIYLHFHKPELQRDLTPEEQFRLDTGSAVGVIARNLFRGGIDISEGGHVTGNDLIQHTVSALQSDNPILYEAGFESADHTLFCRTDTIVLAERRNKVIENKSSTTIKLPEHIYDIGFQWRILSENGFDKSEFYIAHLDNMYRRAGDLDLEKLFVMEDVTTRAKQVQPLIQRHLDQYKKALAKKYEPLVEVGEKCFKPYPCPFKDYCWKNLPSYTVFNIGGIRKSKASYMFSSGIIEPDQIPRNTKLREEQWIEIDSAISLKPSINRKEILHFLGTLNLTGRIHFLDFESLMPAIPQYEGSKPYEQICFQYCLLTRENEDSDLIRTDFVATPGIDPRREFITQLLSDTAPGGPIIVYNQNFEIGRLKELADLFPEFKDKINERIGRVKDLMIPFAKRHFYHPLFKGSHSLKVVAPILCPEIDYAKLEINNGSLAMMSFENIEKHSVLEQKKIISNLKEYCHLDVLSMVKIIEALKRYVQ